MKIEQFLSRMARLFCLASFMGLVLFGSGSIVFSAPASQNASALAIMQVESNQITWQPLTPYARLDLTIAKPDGTLLTRAFPAGSLPVLKLAEAPGAALPNGQYSYELKLTPVLDAVTQAALAAASGDANARSQVVEKLQAAGKLPLVTAMSGAFTVSDGHFVPTEVKEGQDALVAPVAPAAPAPNDIVNADDVIVQGSLCVGFDCVDNESFGFDTIRLKENNTRITFDDTSATAGFPANDWTIVANDSASGGANYLAFEDVTGGKMPFKVAAGAPTNSLFVSSTGRMGLGTGTPVTKLHLVLGDTPAMRLDQDTSSGWTAQVWDLAGNESNFFVRDVTGGSKLPFRIQPGSPTNSLTAKSDGKIGMGTWSPAYDLELERTGQNAVIAADRTDGATAILSAGIGDVRIGSVTNHDVLLVVNNTPVMTLSNQGNMTLAGALSEYSDVNVKENFAPVSGEAVLARLSKVPIMTWNYTADDSNVTHMGPMAQDFYAAFSLGPDNRHIAALDANGVSLVAIQALTKITSDQEARLTALEQENTRLRTQLTLVTTGLLALALLLAFWRFFPLLVQRQNLSH